MNKLHKTLATAVSCGLFALAAGAAMNDTQQSQQSQAGRQVGQGVNSSQAQTGERQTLSGTVNVSKGSNGDIQTIRLMSQDGTSYQVQLNPQGRRLADQNGKRVEVVAQVSQTGGGRQIEILSFSPSDDDAPIGDASGSLRSGSGQSGSTGSGY